MGFPNSIRTLGFGQPLDSGWCLALLESALRFRSSVVKSFVRFSEVFKFGSFHITSLLIILKGFKFKMISHIRLDRSLLEQSKEMDYSKFRQQLKESIRRKMKRESASADACARDDGYGSFFGSSEIVASERVVQEISILLKTQNSSSKSGAVGKPGDSVREIYLMLKSQNSSSKSGDSGRKTKPPQIVPRLNTKVQTLKRTRDYSFLFSDDDTSAAQFPSEKRCSSVSCGGGRGETAAVTVPGRVQSSVERQENKTKVISKNPVSSPKPRMKTPKQNPTLPAMQEHRRTKKPPRNIPMKTVKIVIGLSR
ncbi:PREDICTED: uncharacterized protein LOC104600438 [Nelumbo nucifera]|uniref:Uncharacterized protein LOC104600438 n=1 Tax=Nelumbo nucifera TaxID=4432 RepID=A0A1U8A3K0_NELNU|nr:PREDICTED: uncharacterized protein LOC104600438 [Nelumbo nucifera]